MSEQQQQHPRSEPIVYIKKERKDIGIALAYIHLLSSARVNGGEVKFGVEGTGASSSSSSSGYNLLPREGVPSSSFPCRLFPFSD